VDNSARRRYSNEIPTVASQFIEAVSALRCSRKSELQLGWSKPEVITSQLTDKTTTKRQWLHLCSLYHNAGLFNDLLAKNNEQDLDLYGLESDRLEIMSLK
jgi:hypothetical protein